MPLIVTRTARSIIYLLCIGGLLVLNSLIVTVLWNRVFRDPANSPELSLLEGTGLTAFAYVIVMAVRYGLSYSPKPGTHTNIVPECSNEHPGAASRLSHLSPEQRAALKYELVNRCGCRESSVKP